MRHLDLCSGIGGFALAASWVWPDHEAVSFCEIEPFCQKVLKKHWPDVPCHDDIKTMDGGNFEGIDLLTGGYPCQPFSVAGPRKGIKDGRHIWPEVLRVISKSRPTWVICENVTGHITMGIDDVLYDLEGEGYTTRPFVIPALAVESCHRRDRLWIVANSKGNRLQGISKSKSNGKSSGKGLRPEFAGICSSDIWGWNVKPTMGRETNGIPNRVDRIKALGNAIVPQVAAQIMMAIKQTEKWMAKAA